MARTSGAGLQLHGRLPVRALPYPPKGERSYRVELSEAFCRRQQALSSRRRVRRRAAPWQGALPRDLRQFWKQMEERTQPSDRPQNS